DPAGPTGAEPPAPGEAFAHLSKPGDVSDDYSDLDNVLLNGQPNAAVYAVPVHEPYGGLVIPYDNATGVWYDGAQWAVYNEDGALMTYPVAWNIFVPPPDAINVRHLTTSTNTLGDTTWFSSTALNNHPEELLFVQHVYNPTFAPSGNYFTPTVSLF